MPYLQQHTQAADPPHQLYYLLLDGNSALPYLVFLHEGLGCTAMWGDFPAKLCAATDCPGLVYDRLGHGQSSPLIHKRTMRYLHDSALCELPQLLHKIIPQTPYILIGHSDGGSISLISGAERAPLLRGIITEAAHIVVEERTLRAIKTTDAAWAGGKLKSLTKYHGDKTNTLCHAWSGTWLSDCFSSWNIEYLLPSIRAPLLVIQGTDDQYASANHASRIAAQTGGSARVEMVKGCAHVPHREAQAVVLQLMVEFISQFFTN